MKNGKPKVAIVHDWLVAYAGADRVVDCMHHVFPDAPIYTLVYDENNMPAWFKDYDIRTTYLQKLPFATKLYRAMLPWMPRAFEALDLSEYDMVISSCSSCSKGVITRPDAVHICYCHTPMRYLWDNWPAYMRSTGRLSRLAMRLLLPSLRQWDCLSAQRVDHFVANSRHVARRIRKYWRREAAVVHPPVDTKAFTPRAEPGGEHYLCFGRLASYKRVDLAVEVCTRLGRPLVVAGDGEMMQQLKAKAGPSVRFVGRQDDAAVRELMSRSRALLFPGEEDFGIIPVEAMSSGVPVIAYGRGGATETVVDGETGLLFAEQTPESLADALQRFEQCEGDFDPQRLHAHAEKFSTENFLTGFRHEVDAAMARL